jgi:transposase InsO family protein
VKYARIGKNKAAWPVTVTCEVLSVSTSGYFEHQRRRLTSQPSRTGGGRLSNEALLAHSHSFQDALASCGMPSSMSRKGKCWVNAPTESLWGSLKVGRLYGKKFATQREAMDEVVDWLTFRNHRRLHSTLGYVSPVRFEANWHAGQAKRAA